MSIPENKRFVVVDVETSGGHPYETRITEISLQVSNGRDLISSYTTLINPTVKIPPYVRRLTGITNEMTDSAPVFRQVAKDILKLTQNAVFVAHNVAFDYHVLKSEFKRAGIDWECEQLCTVKASRKIISGLNSYSLGNLSGALDIKISNRHRAEGDARATLDLFHILFERDLASLNEFITPENTNEYALYEKYRHLNLHDIPSRAGLLTVFDDKGQARWIKSGTNLKKIAMSYLKYREKRDAGYNLKQFEVTPTGSLLLAKIMEKESKHKYFKYTEAEQSQDKHPVKFRNRSFMVIDKGPAPDEKSVLLVVKGRLTNYGILNTQNQSNTFDQLKDILEKAQNPHFFSTVADYLEKNKVEKLEFIKS